MTSGRALVNPRLRPARVPAPSGEEVLAFHRSQPGYQPTPLRPLDGTDDAVFLKDESRRLGLPAFKILGASWAVERTLSTRPGTTTLVAASAGNHGRAVARAAANRGVACRIHVPAATSRARREAIRGEGAEVKRVDGDYDYAVRAAATDAETDGTALIADTGSTASAGWVIDGYSTLLREAADQSEDPFDVLVVPVGVGSLAAAAVRHAVHRAPTTAVIGVEPEHAACVTASLAADEPVTVPTPGTSMAGMDCATPSSTAWPTLRDGLTGTIAVTDAETRAAMRRLADDGIVAGDCGAATLAAWEALVDDEDCARLRAAVRRPGRLRVLCIGTEGATDPPAYEHVISGVD